MVVSGVISTGTRVAKVTGPLSTVYVVCLWLLLLTYSDFLSKCYESSFIIPLSQISPPPHLRILQRTSFYVDSTLDRSSSSHSLTLLRSVSTTHPPGSERPSCLVSGPTSLTFRCPVSQPLFHPSPSRNSSGFPKKDSR